MPAVSDRVRLAARHWQLTLGPLLAGGTRSAVYEAWDEAGRDAVLKVPATRADHRDAATDEAAALAAWAKSGAAVAMLDATPDALLLARVRGGALMPWRTAASLDDTIGAAAELLHRLWSAGPGSYAYPTLAQVYPEQERVAREDAHHEQRVHGNPERGMPGVIRLPAAAVVAEELIRTTADPALLHGDFITKNLLSDHTSPVGWVAIDPLPMTGDPAAEVASFAAYQPAELILPIAEALAVRTSTDPRRVLRWTAVWTVHQAAQAWRDDQQELERLVESGVITTLLRQ